MHTHTAAIQGVASAASAALSAAGIGQRDAAERTGIPISTLSRRLTGKTPFNVAELLLIAELTGTTLAELVSRGEANAA